LIKKILIISPKKKGFIEIPLGYFIKKQEKHPNIHTNPKGKNQTDLFIIKVLKCRILPNQKKKPMTIRG